MGLGLLSALPSTPLRVSTSTAVDTSRAAQSADDRSPTAPASPTTDDCLVNGVHVGGPSSSDDVARDVVGVGGVQWTFRATDDCGNTQAKNVTLPYIPASYLPKVRAYNGHGVGSVIAGTVLIA